MKPAADPAPLPIWPSTTRLADYRRATTPESIHAVALGLEAIWQHAPWMLEGVGLHVPPSATWGPWYPGVSAPGWYRVLSGAGEPVRWVRRRPFPCPMAPTPGQLWLRAQVLGQPCLVAPEGVGGQGYRVTPEEEASLGSMDQVRRRVRTLDRHGWSALPQVDPRDAGAVSEALGGFFVPGGLLLDGVMGLALAGGPRVPGWPRPWG